MSGYGKLLRCVRVLWGSRSVVPNKDEPVRDREARTIYRDYCAAHVTDYVAAAELAWQPTEADGPRSISGAEHLRDHLAHDMGLSERDEVTFRMWWQQRVTHGFTERKAA